MNFIEAHELADKLLQEYVDDIDPTTTNEYLD